MKKKLAVALDTNILLRWLMDDVPHQTELSDRTLNDEAKIMHVADVAIIECEWVMRTLYKLDRDQITSLLAEIVGHSRINCNRALFEIVLEYYVKQPALSFADLCLAGYVELSDARVLLTFDKKLASQSDHAELLN